MTTMWFKAKQSTNPKSSRVEVIDVTVFNSWLSCAAESIDWSIRTPLFRFRIGRVGLSSVHPGSLCFESGHGLDELSLGRSELFYLGAIDRLEKCITRGEMTIPSSRPTPARLAMSSRLP
jgi:hypothetical protein